MGSRYCKQILIVVLLLSLSGCGISNSDEKSIPSTSNCKVQSSTNVDDNVTVSDNNDFNLKKSQFSDLDQFNNSSDEPIPIGDDYYLYSKIENHLKKDQYSPNDIKVSLEIINNTDSEIYSDSSFQIEILIDKEWYIIPPTNYFFNDLLGVYPAHGKYNYSIDLGEIEFDYPKGDYRLLKIYSMENFNGTILCESKFKII